MANLDLEHYLSALRTDAPDYEAQATRLRLVAHPVRLIILHLLYDNEELMAGVLEYTLDISQTALSYHLRLLRQAGLITARQSQLRRFYRLKDAQARVLAQAALNL
jgi:DNA-binding transcriptional ArsR family regulator